MSDDAHDHDASDFAAVLGDAGLGDSDLDLVDDSTTDEAVAEQAAADSGTFDSDAGEPDDVEIVESLPDQPLTEVEELTIEVQEFKNMALRLQADFENYRKRVMIQRQDDIERATGKLVESLLPVLDACEAAFAHGVDGVEPIWSQLMGALQKQGLQALDLADKPFDPTHAEAVLHEPGDGGEPVVSEVLRTGYTWNGKTLRAAMVKVRG